MHRQNGSEVARLRRQIEQERESACWALTGLRSGEAQHAFISRRMKHMDLSYQGLAAIVGEEKAIETLCEIWETPTATTTTRAIPAQQ